MIDGDYSNVEKQAHKFERTTDNSSLKSLTRNVILKPFFEDFINLKNPQRNQFLVDWDV